MSRNLLLVGLSERTADAARGAATKADPLTDQDIELIRRHAETIAQVVVEMFVESRRIPE